MVYRNLMLSPPLGHPYLAVVAGFCLLAFLTYLLTDASAAEHTRRLRRLALPTQRESDSATGACDSRELPLFLNPDDLGIFHYRLPGGCLLLLLLLLLLPLGIDHASG